MSMYITNAVAIIIRVPTTAEILTRKITRKITVTVKEYVSIESLSP